jgi:hypothetical protein
MLVKCIISVIVLLIASFGFLFPALRDTARNYNEKRLSEQAQILFQIPSPSHNQVAEMESLPFIKQVFAYYDVFATLAVNDRKLPNYYTMLINDNSSDIFPLTQSTLRLKDRNIRGSSPSAFVDYAFSKEFKVNTGDNLTIGIGSEILSVPIDGIILNCQDYLPIQNDTGGTLIIAISPSKLSDIADKTLQYSGAFLRINDYNRTKDYLQNYKPFGLFREKTSFKNDEDYQKYVRDFSGISYEAEIRDLTHIDVSLSKTENAVLRAFPLTVIMVLCLILIVVVSFSKPDIRYTISTRLKNGEKTNSIEKAIRDPILTIIFLICLSYILILALNLSKSTIYCPILSYFSIIFVNLVIMLFLGIVFAILFAKEVVKKYTGRVHA